MADTKELKEIISLQGLEHQTFFPALTRYLAELKAKGYSKTHSDTVYKVMDYVNNYGAKISPLTAQDFIKNYWDRV